MFEKVITSPLFIFIISLLVALFLFWLGGLIGVKGRKTTDKLSPYACGEDIPPFKPQVNVQRFFIYGLYFLILDAFAFLIALSFTHPGIYPLIFVLIVLLTIVVMVPVKWY